MGFEIEGLLESDGVTNRVVPTGIYPCKIQSAKMDETKDGNEMLRLQFKSLSGGEDDEYKDELFFDQIVHPYPEMSDRGKKFVVAKLKQLLVAAQVEMDGSTYDPEDLFGQELNVSIIEITKDGKPKNEVDEYLLMD